MRPGLCCTSATKYMAYTNRTASLSSVTLSTVSLRRIADDRHRRRQGHGWPRLATVVDRLTRLIFQSLTNERTHRGARELIRYTIRYGACPFAALRLNTGVSHIEFMGWGSFPVSHRYSIRRERFNCWICQRPTWPQTIKRANTWWRQMPLFIKLG